MEKRKPVIGVLPLTDPEKESYWMLPSYMECVQAAGGIPVMLPMTGDPAVLRQLAQTLDAFLFTGGPDILPERYGEERLPVCGYCSEERDDMELKFFAEVLKTGKPILGICRGIQLINTALGGTLYQDIPAQHPSELVHSQPKPYDQPSHAVRIVENSPLEALYGQNELQVTSRHHQAVKEPGRGLEIMAFAGDGLAEAVYMPSQPFVWAVQWHPEAFGAENEDTKKLFRLFIEKAYLCRENSQS